MSWNIQHCAVNEEECPVCFPYSQTSILLRHSDREKEASLVSQITSETIGTIFKSDVIPPASNRGRHGQQSTFRWMQESRTTEFNLTRSCSFLDSPISRSTWWNIDLKVLQRAGLLAGRDAEWTISSANKNRWRRQGAESSITGNKAKITQDAFFPHPTGTPVTCYISGQRTGGQEMWVYDTTNSLTTGVCSGLHSSVSLGQKTTRQQGENTHMSRLITHTRCRKIPHKQL